MKKEGKVKREIKSTVVISSYWSVDRDIEKKIFAAAPRYANLRIALTEPISVEQKGDFELELTYPLDITADQVDEVEKSISDWQHNLVKLYQEIRILKEAGLFIEKRPQKRKDNST